MLLRCIGVGDIVEKESHVDFDSFGQKQTVNVLHISISDSLYSKREQQFTIVINLKQPDPNGLSITRSL